MSLIARHHAALADAYEVEMQALALLMAAAKRRRDAHRELEKFFSPPQVPFPTIVPPPAGPDPDFEDVPDEAAP
jgi:hypothetical protein